MLYPSNLSLEFVKFTCTNDPSRILLESKEWDEPTEWTKGIMLDYCSETWVIYSALPLIKDLHCLKMN